MIIDGQDTTATATLTTDSQRFFSSEKHGFRIAARGARNEPTHKLIQLTRQQLVTVTTVQRVIRPLVLTRNSDFVRYKSNYIIGFSIQTFGNFGQIHDNGFRAVPSTLSSQYGRGNFISVKRMHRYYSAAAARVARSRPSPPTDVSESTRSFAQLAPRSTSPTPFSESTAAGSPEATRRRTPLSRSSR